MSVLIKSRRLLCIFLIAFAGSTFSFSMANSVENVVVAYQLTSVLPPASSAPMRDFTKNQVLARYDERVSAESFVRFASTEPNDEISAGRSHRQRDEPFGLITFRAPEGPLWVKWRKLESEIRADERVISDCRASRDQCSSPAARRFLDLFDGVHDASTRAQIAAVNRAINFQIQYVSDLRQHGIVDAWSPPLATFTSGRGDCEDYAIAKYVAFRQLGLNPEDLRLLVVRDRAVGQDHAVLGVRHEGQWIILDNRHSLLVDVADYSRFIPLLAINQDGVKVFAGPLATRVVEVASVAPGAIGNIPISLPALRGSGDRGQRGRRILK